MLASTKLLLRFCSQHISDADILLASATHRLNYARQHNSDTEILLASATPRLNYAQQRNAAAEILLDRTSTEDQVPQSITCYLQINTFSELLQIILKY